MNESLLRELIPAVTAVLVRRGVDFATAEDAVQDALVRALASWPADPPADPKGWLITVAWRRFLDTSRSDSARQLREARVETEPPPGPAQEADDTLRLYFLCAHPSLTPASAVALTLRAVGGLTTRQISGVRMSAMRRASASRAASTVFTRQTLLRGLLSGCRSVSSRSTISVFRSPSMSKSSRKLKKWL